MMKAMENMRSALEALAATLTVAPTDPGLTASELQEVLGLKQAEHHRMVGLLRPDQGVERSGSRFLLNHQGAMGFFMVRAVDDIRDFGAQQALRAAFSEHWDELGQDHGIDLSVARSSYVSTGGDGRAFDVVVAVVEAMGMSSASDDQNLYRVTPGWHNWFGVEHERQGWSHERVRRHVGRVEAVVAIRHGQTHAVGEPLERFKLLMKRLEYEHMTVWWTQMVAEARAIPESRPVARLVMYTAIAEGILSFVYVVASSSKVSMAKRGPDVKDYKQWTFPQLLAAACTGSDPIVEEPLRSHLLELNKDRQRIHAGRMLLEARGRPLPKLDVNKGRDARRTTERLAGRVVEWLEQHTGESAAPE